MELKCRLSATLLTTRLVPIEPLWNWNRKDVSHARSRHTVPIEPLWNWNNDAVDVLHTQKLYQSNLYGIEIDVVKLVANESIVPIEPLWNWNLARTSTATSGACTNRTFMELKWGRSSLNINSITMYQSNLYGIEMRERDLIRLASASTNRTFMELKSRSVWRTQRRKLSTNRTFMELK